MQISLLSATLPTALDQMLICRSALIQSCRISLYLPLRCQSHLPLCRPQVMLKLLITLYKAPHSQVPIYHSPFLSPAPWNSLVAPPTWLLRTSTYLYANCLCLEFLYPSSCIIFAAASEWVEVLGIGYGYRLWRQSRLESSINLQCDLRQVT